MPIFEKSLPCPGGRVRRNWPSVANESQTMRAVAVDRSRGRKVEIVELGKPKLGPYQALVQDRGGRSVQRHRRQAGGRAFSRRGQVPAGAGPRRRPASSRRSAPRSATSSPATAPSAGWCSSSPIRDTPAAGAASANTRWSTITTPWWPTAWPTPSTAGSSATRSSGKVDPDIAAGGGRAAVHLARGLRRLRRFQPQGRRRHPGLRRRAGGAELRQVRQAAGAGLDRRGRSAGRASGQQALAMGADAVFAPGSSGAGGTGQSSAAGRWMP